jgi:glyoxylase-like metal-dependent hydrolase (beta-lactamase superfamily II)
MGERISIGSIECEVVSDGTNLYPLEMVFAGVPREALPRFGEGELDEQGRLILPYNPLLIRAAGRLILIDAGAGESAGEPGSPAGRLQESLRHAGVRNEDIDIVVVTHAHPDHIGGLTRAAGADRLPVFSSARHLFWKGEWDFWTSAEALAALPKFLSGPAQVHLPALGASGLVERVDAEIDIVPGVRLFPAPGHTPGHMCVAISSNGEQAIFAADVVVHESNFAHPEWMTAFEADAPTALATRQRVYAQAAESRSLFIGFHLWSPGHVEGRVGSYGFRATKAPVAAA